MNFVNDEEAKIIERKIFQQALNEKVQDEINKVKAMKKEWRKKYKKKDEKQ